MAIAIFGGSFNPVHFGHFEIVRHCISQLRFSKVIVVPAYKNPLKEDLPSIPETIRLKMLAETFAEFDNVEISTFELKKRKTSFTYNTLEHFRKRHPRCRFHLILGEDAFASFHLWAKADKILKWCTLVLYKRPGANASSPPGLQWLDVQWVNALIPDISATEIRKTSPEQIKQKQWLHPNAYKTWEQFTKNVC